MTREVSIFHTSSLGPGLTHILLPRALTALYLRINLAEFEHAINRPSLVCGTSATPARQLDFRCHQDLSPASSSILPFPSCIALQLLRDPCWCSWFQHCVDHRYPCRSIINCLPVRILNNIFWCAVEVHRMTQALWSFHRRWSSVINRMTNPWSS